MINLIAFNGFSSSIDMEMGALPLVEACNTSIKIFKILSRGTSYEDEDIVGMNVG